MQRNKLLFHPLFVLICAALGILTYVAWMRWRFPGGNLANNFMYVLPIIVPFVAFIFDRAKYFPDAVWLESIVDCAVVITSIMRIMGDVPLVSGHALFLTYAIVRPGSWVTRVTAALVMIQVIYLKFFLWHDWVTPITGITLGLLAAFVVRRAAPRSIASMRPLPNL